MNLAQSSELATKEIINQVAFRHFLEKGYEATNLRKISDEVGIKSASVYFYYKSKSDLFFSILNGICKKQIDMILAIKKQYADTSPEERLYRIYKGVINDCIDNNVEYKFRLRFRMFPVEELALQTREIYHIWQEKEYQACLNIISDFVESKKDKYLLNERVFFHMYQRLINSIMYDILLSEIIINEEMLKNQWKQFLDSTYNNEIWAVQSESISNE